MGSGKRIARGKSLLENGFVEDKLLKGDEATTTSVDQAGVPPARYRGARHWHPQRDRRHARGRRRSGGASDPGARRGSHVEIEDDDRELQMTLRPSQHRPPHRAKLSPYAVIDISQNSELDELGYFGQGWLGGRIVHGDQTYRCPDVAIGSEAWTPFPPGHGLNLQLVDRRPVRRRVDLPHPDATPRGMEGSEATRFSDEQRWISSAVRLSMRPNRPARNSSVALVGLACI